MLTAFWMLAAESVPVRKVSRPSVSGFWTSSRMRTDPSGLSSARSMRTPLDPTSITERTGGAGAATLGAGGAGARADTGLEHPPPAATLPGQIHGPPPHRPARRGGGPAP